MSDKHVIEEIGINVATILRVLTDKNIVTNDEFRNLKCQITHKYDQALQAKKDEKKKEFDEKYPGIREAIMDLFGADIFE